jgi:predicted lipoprotein with Yx(FWY)xxD motif
MRRSVWFLIGLIIIIAIVLGLYFGFHNSNNNKPTSGSNTAQISGTNPPSTTNSVVLTKTSPSLGQYLTDPTGKPLYTYNADTSGVSNCTGSCLSSWPPYVATKTTNLPNGVGTIKRTDTGAMQYTYNGLPLYYFTGDSNSTPTGNGVQNFSIAKPASSSNNTSNSSNSSGGYPY